MPSITDRVGDLGAYLREQREHARLSVRQLAALTGVSNPYLSQIERGLRHPSAEVLQQLAKGLRISAEALYVRAGILDDDRRLDVEVAVHADPVLSERQKRVLLDIYATFRAESARAGQEEPPETPAPVAPPAEPVENQPPTRTPKASVPKGAVPKGAVPKGAVPKGAVPKSSVPKSSVPKSSVPKAAGSARPRPRPTREDLLGDNSQGGTP